MAPQWPQDGQDRPKMATRWPKTALTWPQDGPILAQDGPKLTPKTPKMGARDPQEGGQIGPKSVFQGFPTSKPKKGVPGPISNADLGRLWPSLGVHIGLMLGPMRTYKAS